MHGRNCGRPASSLVPLRAATALHLVMSAVAPLSVTPRPVDLELAATFGTEGATRPLHPLGYRPEAGRGKVSFRSHGSGEATHGAMHKRRATWGRLVRHGTRVATGLLGGEG